VRFSEREDVLIVILAINSGCLPRELELVGLENRDAVCLPEGRTDVQDDSVMFRQVSGVSFSHQSEMLYKNISESEWFLSLIGKVHSTVNTVTV